MEDKTVAVIEVEDFKECNTFLKLEDCFLIKTYVKNSFKLGYVCQQIVYVLEIKSYETLAKINRFRHEKEFSINKESYKYFAELTEEREDVE